MIHSPTLTIEDESWDEIISSSLQYDFYHTRSYHKLEVRNKQDKALLFVSRKEDTYIALPLIIRSIEGTPYFDCTSVYGYCGPVSNMRHSDISEENILKFQDDLNLYFKENNIIAAFSRLHPLIASESIFSKFGKIRLVNKTIAIDIQSGPEAQRKHYRKSNKSELNQLRKKKGYSVREATTDKDLQTFVDIYNETMKRVNASDYYFFDLDYFKSLLNNPDYNAILFLAVKDETITAGAIFTITNSLMQYHLAGTAAPYISDTPMKLVLDEARLKANELNLDFLHLGGGVGGSDEDSLFRFKSGFSKNFFQFSTWQYIANEPIYKQLVEANGVLESDFFPLYRAPKKL